jgi:hypothetical protein
MSLARVTISDEAVVIDDSAAEKPYFAPRDLSKDDTMMLTDDDRTDSDDDSDIKDAESRRSDFGHVIPLEFSQEASGRGSSRRGGWFRELPTRATGFLPILAVVLLNLAAVTGMAIAVFGQHSSKHQEPPEQEHTDVLSRHSVVVQRDSTLAASPEDGNEMGTAHMKVDPK